MTSTALQTPLELPSEDFRKSVHVCHRGGVGGCCHSPAIDNRQSKIDNPSILLPGNVLIFAARDGDQVTGRVEFPYEVGGRTSVPIDYKNSGPSPVPLFSCSTDLDAKASSRLALVEQWRALCDQNPKWTRRRCAEAVAAQSSVKCGLRVLQVWARKLDTAGPQALSDQYAPAPRKLLSLDSKLASDAVSVCAWWAFRVANVDRIDSLMMHHAAQAMGRASYLADVLAAIDCYYSWDTDRERYPFKPFARWAKYDVETWLGRAADEEDYRSRLPEDRTPLQAALSVGKEFPGVPDARTRKRDTRDRTTRSALDALRASVPSCLRASTSVHDAILSLDDRMRRMLFLAARGDAQARREAVATMPLWWERMPETVRNNIQCRVAVGRSGFRQPTDREIRSRKLLMLFADLQRDRRAFAASPVSVGMAL